MATTKIVSDVPGTVCRVEASIGQALEEDDPILFVESMKMEIPAAAPRAGTVKEILVAQGDTVAEGQTVAIIEH